MYMHNTTKRRFTMKSETIVMSLCMASEGFAGLIVFVYNYTGHMLAAISCVAAAFT